jgi:hypothetical protein
MTHIPKAVIEFMGDLITVIPLGHGEVSFYVYSIDTDFTTLQHAKDAIQGMLQEPNCETEV